MKQNILILGGLGFIGSNLVEEFLTYPAKYNIFIYEFPGKQNRFGNDIELIEGDFNNQLEVEKVFRENKIDQVFHLVSNTIPATSNENILYDIESNLVPTINLLNTLVKHKVLKIVFFSSGGSVYGVPENNPVSESHPTFPISSHGTIKLTIEKYLHLFNRLYGLNYLIFRPGNPYGPYQSSDKQGLINVFFRRMVKNQDVFVRGDGSAFRDYIYIKDMVRVVKGITVDIDSVNNEIINLGSGQGLTINEIISFLKSELSYKGTVHYDRMLSSDVPGIILNVDKMKKLFPLQLTTLQEGIRKMLDTIA